MNDFDQKIKRGKLDKSLNETKVIMKAEMFIFFMKIGLKKMTK
jgi:hypothetical protein